MAQEALKIKTYRIKLIMVLFVCMVIMGLDRSSVSVAAPIMMEELGIAPSQMGLLLSAFFLDVHVMQHSCWPFGRPVRSKNGVGRGCGYLVYCISLDWMYEQSYRTDGG